MTTTTTSRIIPPGGSTHIVRPGSITGDTRIGFTGTAYCGIRVGHEETMTTTTTTTSRIIPPGGSTHPECVEVRNRMELGDRVITELVAENTDTGGWFEGAGIIRTRAQRAASMERTRRLIDSHAVGCELEPTHRAGSALCQFRAGR